MTQLPVAFSIYVYSKESKNEQNSFPKQHLQTTMPQIIACDWWTNISNETMPQQADDVFQHAFFTQLIDGCFMYLI